MRIVHRLGTRFLLAGLLMTVVAGCGLVGGGDDATAINAPYGINFDGTGLSGWLFYDPLDPNTAPSANVNTLWQADGSPLNMPGGSSYSGGVSLNYNLNLGNRTSAYAERSGQASVRAAIIEYDREELQVTSEVRAAQRGVHFAVEQVAATTTSLELARRQLEAENARFAQDLSTTFQVLEFQHNLIEAMSNERAARAGFVKALAELDNALGVFPRADPEPAGSGS